MPRPALILMVASLLAAPAPALAQDTAELLTNIRAALGLPRLASHPAGIRLAGDETNWGDPGQTEYVFDPQWRLRIERSAKLSTVEAMDGPGAWITEIGGETHECWFRERSQMITEVGAVSGLLLADGAGIAWTIDPAQSNDTLVSLAADLEQGHTKAAVIIDRKTCRPVSWRFLIGGQAHRYDVRGVLEFDGIRFPREVQRSADQTLTLKIAEAAAPDRARYRLTPGRPADWAFDAAHPPSVEARKGPDGRIFVHPRIDGKDVGWFLFDTGAPGTFVLPSVLTDLGLAPFGSAIGGGIGPELGALQFARAHSLSLGPLTITEPLLDSGDMNIALLGDDVRGVIGYPVAARAVVEFDPEGAAVRLFHPDTYALPTGVWVRLDIDDRMPVFAGQAEGRKAHFRIDTGGASTVFNVPTVRSWKMLEGHTHEPDQARGVGGIVSLQRSTLTSIGLADYLSLDPPVHLATDPASGFNDTYTNASIGIHTLRSFVLILDYAHQRAAVVSRENWAAVPRTGR